MTTTLSEATGSIVHHLSSLSRGSQECKNRNTRNSEEKIGKRQQV